MVINILSSPQEAVKSRQMSIPSTGDTPIPGVYAEQGSAVQDEMEDTGISHTRSMRLQLMCEIQCVVSLFRNGDCIKLVNMQ